MDSTEPAPLGVGLLGGIAKGLQGYLQGKSLAIQRNYAASELARQNVLEQVAVNRGANYGQNVQSLVAGRDEKTGAPAQKALVDAHEADAAKGASAGYLKSTYPTLYTNGVFNGGAAATGAGTPQDPMGTPAVPSGAVTPDPATPTGAIPPPSPGNNGAPMAPPLPGGVADGPPPTVPAVPMSPSTPAAAGPPPTASIGLPMGGPPPVPSGQVASPATQTAPVAQPAPNYDPDYDLGAVSPARSQFLEQHFKDAAASYLKNVTQVTDPAVRHTMYLSTMANLAHYTQNGQPIDPSPYGVVDPKSLAVPMSEQDKQMNANRQQQYDKLWGVATGPAFASMAPQARQEIQGRLDQLTDAMTPGAPHVKIPAPGATPGEQLTAQHQMDALAQQKGFHSQDEQDKALTRGIENSRLTLEQSNATNKQAAGEMYFHNIDARIAALRSREQLLRPTTPGAMAGVPTIPPSPDQIAKWRATTAPIENEISALAAEKASAAAKYGISAAPQGPPAPPISGVKVTPQSVYATLPRGATYVGPDGKTYRKG